jgi:hypothetical protein
VIAPAAGGVLGTLTQITTTFSKPVIGVDAGDLLINGIPASTVTGNAPTNVYTFIFTQPLPGLVSAMRDELHGIADLNGAAFVPTGGSALWTYTLADNIPPQVSERTPAAGIKVSHLNQTEILFSEPVQGVNASDLLINGQPATNVTGQTAGSYVFQFPQPAAGTVQFSWAGGHGITDLAAAPNAFAGGNWTNTLDLAFGLPTIRINEFLASSVNTNGLRDEFGDLEDWIEIYNYGGAPVDLTGCALTDNSSQPGQWVFPQITLGANQYLVVFASGLDRKVVGGTNKLHTSFSLSTSGEYLGLYNAESPRSVIDELAPTYPDQRNDYSYGRDPLNALRYFATPTPGTANGSSSITGVVANVHFTVPRGFFEQPFSLLLTTPTPDATIRYTTDGSPPTETGGLIYTNALFMDHLTLLRAAAFETNMLPSLVETHTYIFLTNVLNQPTNPAGFPIDVTWTIDHNRLSDYAMDQRVVTNAAYAAEMKADLLELPTLSIVAKMDDTFGTNGFYQGFDPLGYRPEKPCSVELINPDGSSGFQIDAGVSMHGGGSSRSTMKHPLNLKFRGKYGQGKLNYRFFKDSPVDKFDSLVLRADYNNHWAHGDLNQRSRGSLVRDAFFKDVQTAMGDLSSHSSYVHLYINGLYWGVYNPCDDLDNNFAAATLGGSDADYDVVKASTGQLVVDENTIAMNAMQALDNSGLSSLNQYNQIRQYLDVAQYADYFMLQNWGGDMDWNQTGNWSALRERQPGAGFKFMCWDSERTLEGINDIANQAGPLGLHGNLINNAEYRLAFADRVHKHFFNNGALTTNGVIRLWNERASQIQAAIVAESARWGDSVPNGKGVITPLPYPSYNTNVPYYSRDENWLGEQGRLMTNYFPLRSSLMLDRFRSAGLYPFTDAPEFNQNGGRVNAGFSVAISAPVGTIYYTTNGADPRVYGTGAVSPDARIYTGAITLNNSMTVKARVSNGEWSALCEADFTVGEIGSPLRITEIMYNPTGGNNFEFIEVQNTGGNPLDVSGFTFQGITYAFPATTLIPPGGVLLLANSANPSAVASRYPGAVVFGYFSGSLDNGGERIAILDGNGQTVTAVHYDDENGWPTAADGGGYSLEVIDPLGDPNAPANWRASAALNGTPGLPPAAPPALGNIVLSEVMADNLSTITNGGTLPDWVELQNRGVSAVNLANWSLSDYSNPRKFVFPANTILNPESYLVVWCDSATNAPGLHTGFALGKSGDNVFLYDTTTNRVDAVTFGLQLSDRSIGRIGNNWQLNIPTPNANNIAATLASPTNISINEWLAESLPGTEDWIELFNRSSNAPVQIGNLYLGTSNALFRISSLSFLGSQRCAKALRARPRSWRSKA